MTESQLYEALGRKQAIIEQQDAAYTRIIALLAEVIAGDVHPSRVLVNLTDRTWEIASPGQTPAMPAQINGLPFCVTGKPESAAERIEALSAKLKAEA